MASLNWQRIREIFEKCVELEPNEQQMFLDRECGNETALRQEVQKLLDDNLQANSKEFLEWPDKADETSAHDASKELDGSDLLPTESVGPPDQQTHRRIGPYKLLQEIGHGGMGEVWLAQQSDPVNRRVAVKLIKSQLSGQSEIARFETERQALALMDHPNIAKVFDGGTTEDGLPYFVMEFINGKSLTEYCDKHALNIRDRLQVFIPICRAIQHAHQKGIIHRDVKPSNILVNESEGVPIPKVIDFGLAKATDHQRMLTDKTLYTEIGKVIGTLQYMSPEQARLDSRDIDSRTDIYSLGVVLYELLVGSTPVNRETIRNKSWNEVLSIIRDSNPLPPSLRISESQRKDVIIGKRSVSSARLSQILRGDLDWIVLKALEKESDRRYETAAALADDVQRFLNDEPVVARPPSTRYRVTKFVRKHRAGVSAASLVILALIAGIITTTWQMNRALAAEAIAGERTESERIAKIDAQKKGREAIAAANRETTERKYAEAISDFVKNDFLALTSSDGRWRFDNRNQSELSQDSTLRELLDRAAEKLSKTGDQLAARTEADLSWIIGVSYKGMGESALAIPFLEKCVELRKMHFGKYSPLTLNAQNSLAIAIDIVRGPEAAIPLQEQTYYDGRQHLDNDEFYGTIYGVPSNLADMYSRTGRTNEAVKILRQDCAIVEKHFGKQSRADVQAKGELAKGLFKAGLLDEAMQIANEYLPIVETKFRNEINLPYVYRSAVGAISVSKGDYTRAEKIFTDFLYDRAWRRGGEDSWLALPMFNLAVATGSNGNLNFAIHLMERAEQLARTVWGPDNQQRLLYAIQQSRFFIWANRHDDAIALLKEIIVTSKKSSRSKQRSLAAASLILAYQEAHRFDELEDLVHREAARAEDRILVGPEGQRQLSAIGFGLLVIGDIEDAEGILRKCVKLGDGMTKTWPHFLAQSRLGDALLRQGKAIEATPLIQSSYSQLEEFLETIPKPRRERVMLEAFERNVRLQEQQKSDSLKLASLYFELGTRHAKLQQWRDAENALRKCLDVRETGNAPDIEIVETRSLLGWAIANQLKSNEESERSKQAISLLTQAFRNYHQLSLETKTDKNLSESVDAALQRIGSLPGAQLIESLQILRDNYPSDASRQIELAHEFDKAGQTMAKTKKWSAAEAFFEANLEIRVQDDRVNWRRLRAQSLLGWAITQNRHDRGPERDRKAAELLVKGYVGLKKGMPTSWITPAALDMLTANEDAIRLYEEVLPDIKQRLVDYELDFHTKETGNRTGSTHYGEFAKWLQLFRSYSHVLRIRGELSDPQEVLDEMAALFTEKADSTQIVSDGFAAVEIAHFLNSNDQSENALRLLTTAIECLRNVILNDPRDAMAESAFRRAILSKRLLFTNPSYDETVELIHEIWELPEKVVLKLARDDGRHQTLNLFDEIPDQEFLIIGVQFNDAGEDSIGFLQQLSLKHPLIDIGLRGDHFDQDEAISVINNCHILNALWINFNGKVSHEHLAKLSPLPLLRHIGFWYSAKIDDECLPFVAKHKALESINLTGGSISGNGIGNLYGLHHVGLVWISASKKVGSNEPSIDDQALKAIGEWPQLDLRELGLTGSGVTDDGLRYLSVLTNLRRLNLGGTTVNGTGLAALIDLPIDALELDNCPLTDQSADAVGRFEKLVRLQIPGTKITEKFLAELPQSLPLRVVDVPRNSITEDAAKSLQNRWKDCKINLK